jgi:hypothetical protein
VISESKSSEQLISTNTPVLNNRPYSLPDNLFVWYEDSLR